MTDALEHIADQAGLIASLPKSDPQRKLAEKHARSCAPCRQALREGSRLVVMLRRELSVSLATGEPIGGAARPPTETEEATLEGVSRRLAWVTVGAEGPASIETGNRTLS